MSVRNCQIRDVFLPVKLQLFLLALHQAIPDETAAVTGDDFDFLPFHAKGQYFIAPADFAIVAHANFLANRTPADGPPSRWPPFQNVPFGIVPQRSISGIFLPAAL